MQIQGIMKTKCSYWLYNHKIYKNKNYMNPYFRWLTSLWRICPSSCLEWVIYSQMACLTCQRFNFYLQKGFLILIAQFLGSNRWTKICTQKPCTFNVWSDSNKEIQRIQVYHQADWKGGERRWICWGGGLCRYDGGHWY